MISHNARSLVTMKHVRDVINFVIFQLNNRQTQISLVNGEERNL